MVAINTATNLICGVPVPEGLHRTIMRDVQTKSPFNDKPNGVEGVWNFASGACRIFMRKCATSRGVEMNLK